MAAAAYTDIFGFVINQSLYTIANATTGAEKTFFPQSTRIAFDTEFKELTAPPHSKTPEVAFFESLVSIARLFTNPALPIAEIKQIFIDDPSSLTALEKQQLDLILNGSGFLTNITRIIVNLKARTTSLKNPDGAFREAGLSTEQMELIAKHAEDRITALCKNPAIPTLRKRIVDEKPLRTNPNDTLIADLLAAAPFLEDRLTTVAASALAFGTSPDMDIEDFYIRILSFLKGLLPFDSVPLYSNPQVKPFAYACMAQVCRRILKTLVASGEHDNLLVVPITAKIVGRGGLVAKPSTVHNALERLAEKYDALYLTSLHPPVWTRIISAVYPLSPGKTPTYSTAAAVGVMGAELGVDITLSSPDTKEFDAFVGAYIALIVLAHLTALAYETRAHFLTDLGKSPKPSEFIKPTLFLSGFLALGLAALLLQPLCAKWAGDTYDQTPGASQSTINDVAVAIFFVMFHLAPFALTEAASRGFRLLTGPLLRALNAKGLVPGSWGGIHFTRDPSGGGNGPSEALLAGHTALDVSPVAAITRSAPRPVPHTTPTAGRPRNGDTTGSGVSLPETHLGAAAVAAAAAAKLPFRDTGGGVFPPATRPAGAAPP